MLIRHVHRLCKYLPAKAAVGWKPAVLYAIPVCLFIIGLFHHWFAVADRYAVFLYGHLGATPFDRRTTSRYWMSGLVASGAVMILYAYANWFLGRVAGMCHRRYLPPGWWQVWLLCLVPLGVAIPTITMRFNQPVLPASIAVACLAATLIGLALALMPGTLAAQCPSELAWLGLAGAGLMPSLLLLRAVELPASGLAGPGIAYSMAIGGTLAGAVWAAAVTWLRARRRKAPWEKKHLIVAGLCLSYLLMPLAHHLLLTPAEYRYITSSTNVFAFSRSVQVVSLLVAVSLATGVISLQRKWLRLSSGPGSGTRAAG